VGLLEHPAAPGPPSFPGSAGTADLVAAARDGDGAAWDALVERYCGLVWAVARAHRLGQADAADVSQTVWLRLVENLGRIRDPDHLGGWLRTTTRNECLRVLRRGGREFPDDDAQQDLPADRADSPEDRLLAGERDRVVWRAVSGLSERCRELLRVLAYSPDASYADISSSLGLPVGSIGPTRARCLAHLRKGLEGVGYLAAAPEGKP
jgi:RNA polymerase sigma factor (sigma-70 family)